MADHSRQAATADAIRDSLERIATALEALVQPSEVRVEPWPGIDAATRAEAPRYGTCRACGQVDVPIQPSGYLTPHAMPATTRPCAAGVDY